MTLYEATNGGIGESYLRCYVWSIDRETAVQLATVKFNECDERKHTIVLKELMYDHSIGFVTDVSDSGWEM